MISYANNSFHSQPLSLSADNQQRVADVARNESIFQAALKGGDAECGAH